VKNRFRAKQQRRIRDMEHKISQTVVAYTAERQAGTLAIGDVRDIADAPHMGRHQNQKLSSRRVYGDVGKVRPPPIAMYRHPIRSGKRSCRDTGQPATAVACALPQEAAGH